MHILMAEDDVNLGILLRDYLLAEGHTVTLCRDGEKALQAFRQYPFDICLLDIMMPKLDGFSVAKVIREENNEIPLLILSAKSLKEDKLKGYHLGADDYITKPFDIDELNWKIHALVRRVPAKLKPENTITIGTYRFDFHNQQLLLGNKTKRITEKECHILLYLCKHRNQVVKREDILKEVWGENDYFLGRSLDVFITKIRKYLIEDPTLTIENVFGVGFVLNAPS